MSTDENSDGVHIAPDEIRLNKPSCTKIEESDTSVKCAMCHMCVHDSLNYGDLYQCGDMICHYFCLLFSSSLIQNGSDDEGILGFFPKDIQKEIRRGSRLKCSFCRKTGATIGCHLKSCKKTFHLPCGLKSGSMHQFFDQFLSFCSTHRPSQKVEAIKEDDDALTCPICYEPVPNVVSNNTLWAPCCRRRWFHRSCVQRQALAQGYFFKCPMCNNKKEFNSEMKTFGIYIPEMDAAWEREPNAFQDLLQTYKNCDASSCKCPDGRIFFQNTGSWRLLRCNSCGSQGTHIVCGGLKIAAASNSWRCSSCSKVIYNAKLERDPPNNSTSYSSGSSSSATLSSSSTTQRRIASSVLESQVIKRMRPSRSPSGQGDSSIEMQPCSSRQADQIPLENVSKNDELPSPSSVSSTDEDEIVVVDDSESDVEVVEVVSPQGMQSSRTSQHVMLSQYANKELLTNDGQKIKVHKVNAGGDVLGTEVCSLGDVRVSHPKQGPSFKVEVEKTEAPDIEVCYVGTSKSPSKVKIPSNPSTSRETSASQAVSLSNSVLLSHQAPTSSTLPTVKVEYSNESGRRRSKARSSQHFRTNHAYYKSRKQFSQSSWNFQSTSVLLHASENGRWPRCITTNDSQLSAPTVKPAASSAPVAASVAAVTAAAAAAAAAAGATSPGATTTKSGERQFLARCDRIGLVEQEKSLKRLRESPVKDKPCPKRYKRNQSFFL